MLKTEKKNLMDLSYDCVLVISWFFETSYEVTSFLLIHKNINEFLSRPITENRTCENVVFPIELSHLNLQYLEKKNLYYVKSVVVNDGSEWVKKNYELFHLFILRFPLLQNINIINFQLDNRIGTNFPFTTSHHEKENRNFNTIKKISLRSSFLMNNVKSLFLISNILKCFPKVEDLEFTFLDFNITKKNIPDIPVNRPGIKSLDFYMNRNLKMDGLNRIFLKFSKLEKLKIYSYERDEHFLNVDRFNFQQFHSLTYLKIDGLKKTRDFIVLLERFPNLEIMMLREFYINTHSFPFSPNLKKLDVVGGIATQSLSFLLNQLPSIELFSIGFGFKSRQCELAFDYDAELGEKPEFIDSIKPKESMKIFHISSVSYEMNELMRFSLKFPNLREISLDKMVKTKDTPREIIHKNKKFQYKIYTLGMSYSETDEFSSSRTTTTTNETPQIKFCKIIENSKITVSLRTIEFQGFNEKINTPELFEFLSRLINLESIHFEGCAFESIIHQEEEEEEVTIFNNLVDVYLTKCKIPKSVIQWIVKRWINLKYFRMNVCAYEPINLSEIINRMKQLKFLVVKNIILDEHNINPYSSSQQLKHLNVPESNLGVKGLLKIMNIFPDLEEIIGMDTKIEILKTDYFFSEDINNQLRDSLKVLNLSKNIISISFAVQSIYFFKKLNRLTLDNCGMKYTNGAFRENFQQEKILKETDFRVSLRGNEISFDGICEFLELFVVVPVPVGSLSDRMFYFSKIEDDPESDQKKRFIGKKYKVYLGMF